MGSAISFSAKTLFGVLKEEEKLCMADGAAVDNKWDRTGCAGM